SRIMEQLWNLFDEADIVIAHNAVKFDCRKANTRFIANGLKLPSPVKVVDTLKMARRDFAFTSNRLGDLGVFLGVGKKLKTGGFDLWKGCMSGHKPSWDKMVKYCKGDVRLLEKVYLKLRPFSRNHPNSGVYEGEMKCICGSTRLQKRGFAVTNAQRYQRYQCQSCGSWCRDKIATIKGRRLTANV
ncbi:unnamed protein product, partial [marine sediment metagenome]